MNETKFNFYRLFYDAISALPKENQLAAYNGVCRYVFDNEMPDKEDKIANAIVVLVKEDKIANAIVMLVAEILEQDQSGKKENNSGNSISNNDGNNIQAERDEYGFLKNPGF